MWEIGRRLAQKGHSVTFVAGDYPGAKRGRINGVNHVRLGSARSQKLSVFSYYLNYPVYLREVAEDYDILLEGWTSPFPLTPMLLRQKVVAWVHILEGPNLLKYLGPLGFPNLVSERALTTLYDNYILSSPDYMKLNARKNVLICPPAFDPNLLELEDEEEDYILFLGRLGAGGTHQKGLDFAIRCFSETRSLMPDIRLVVAGNVDSDARRYVERIRHGVVGVQFVEKPTEELKRDLIRKCLLVCMPSRYESAGIVALEAQACGKPVVGFDIPGLNSVVKNGETGILVRAFDLHQLRGALEFLLTHPRERRALGEKGRKWSTNFTWETAADKVERFVTSLVSA